MSKDDATKNNLPDALARWEKRDGKERSRERTEQSFRVPNVAIAAQGAGSTLTANQLDFISLIVTYLTEHGVIDVDRLYEAPFTDVAPEGPESLFSGADVDLLVATLDAVRKAASGVA